MKGAAERVLGFCDRVLVGDQVVVLTPELREEIRRRQLAFAGQALRVVAAAYKEMPADADTAERSDAESGCIFVGFWGLMDPPRPRPPQPSRQRNGRASP